MIYPDFPLYLTGFLPVQDFRIIVLHNCMAHFWRWTSLLNASNHQSKKRKLKQILNPNVEKKNSREIPVSSPTDCPLREKVARVQQKSTFQFTDAGPTASVQSVSASSWNQNRLVTFLVDEDWNRLTAVFNFGVFNGPKMNLNSAQIVQGFRSRQNLYNSLFRQQSSSLSPSEPLQVTWRSLGFTSEGYPEDIEGFDCKINDWALVAVLGHRLGWSDGQAQPQSLLAATCSDEQKMLPLLLHWLSSRVKIFCKVRAVMNPYQSCTHCFARSFDYPLPCNWALCGLSRTFFWPNDHYGVHSQRSRTHVKTF